MRPVKALMMRNGRLIKACAIVLAILCMAPGVDALAGAFATVDVKGSGQVGVSTEGLHSESDPFGALDRIDESLEGERGELPAAYVSEIGLLEGADDIRVNASGSIIGYCVEGNDEEVLDDFTQAMAERGWSAVPLGGVVGATFVKGEGSYTWMLATCTQVGSATSVVTRCIAHES